MYTSEREFTVFSKTQVTVDFHFCLNQSRGGAIPMPLLNTVATLDRRPSLVVDRAHSADWPYLLKQKVGKLAHTGASS